MNERNSQETLLRVEQNDDTLTKLSIGSVDGGFDFYRLGIAIATNNYITKLWVHLDDSLLRGISDAEFYDGLKQNSSISKLLITCNVISRDLNRAGRKILEAYQENRNLTNISISNAANLHNGGATQITTTLQCCTNLESIDLFNCNVTPEQILPMVDAMKGIRSLEQLFLNDNRIGYHDALGVSIGCEALATLLKAPNCNIHTLELRNNNITNEGAITIANSLANNTKLQKLDLSHNPIVLDSVWGKFSNALCNTSGIDDTYSSNHTLQKLRLNYHDIDNSLLRLNKDANKSHVAIKKILKHHPDIDMEPLFGWDKGGEWTLKALPYVVAWFERACAAKAAEVEESRAFLRALERSRINRRTLSTIYKFAKAMPMLFVPTDHAKMHDKKRKRSDEQLL